MHAIAIGVLKPISHPSLGSAGSLRAAGANGEITVSSDVSSIKVKRGREELAAAGDQNRARPAGHRKGYLEAFANRIAKPSARSPPGYASDATDDLTSRPRGRIHGMRLSRPSLAESTRGPIGSRFAPYSQPSVSRALRARVRHPAAMSCRWRNDGTLHAHPRR